MKTKTTKKNNGLLYTVAAVLALPFFISIGQSMMGGKHSHASPDNSSASAPVCNCGSLQVTFSGNVPGDALFFGNQTNADCFAWSEFIALNWPSDPADSFGQPGNTDPVQWETYMPREVMFQPQGVPPPAWGTLVSQQYVSKFKSQKLLLNRRKTKLLTFTDKFEDITEAQFDSTNTGQAFPFNAPSWLGAQNGTNVWYEVLLNKDIYDFVVANKYYNAQNQYDSVKKGKPFNFPQGVYNGVTGAIELKAAWMEVTDPANQKWNHYKLSYATVLDPNTGKLRNTTVALVGLHILHKTAKQPTWVWATFEHVDNVPDSGTVATGEYNFYNASCTPQQVTVPNGCLATGQTSPVTVGCQANVPPPYYLCKGGPAPKPVQVSRLTPIDATATSVNSTMQGQIAQLFPNSVFQYYELVNVIWSTNPQPDPATPIPSPRQLNPQYMQPTIPVANSTMESYIQRTTCTGCHTGSTIAPSPSDAQPDTFGDFSFAISFASYPTPPSQLHKKKVKK